ncbi:hypothetical protein ABZ307_42800 [Streptomyces griseorubiginosus]|uniref:hypothetical protein n=1 Tax=Streptomyces griseorubiginosus TaxID=67304 RepID=UPI0033A080A0
MTGGSGLSPQDRDDFESVLRQALDRADIRSALAGEGAGRAVTRLQIRARSAAEEIAAAAEDEYRAYRAARDTAGVESRTPRAGRPGGDGTGWLLLTVLTPLVSAGAAAVLLLIGYGLQVAVPAAEFGSSVSRAGWTLALLAVLASGVSLCVLVSSGLRRREEPTGTPVPAAVDRARERWRKALLERGVLPWLHGQLSGQSRELPNSRR